MSTTFFTAAPDQLVRARNRALREAGDLGLILRHAGEWMEGFARAISPGPGARVLEVACGTGQLIPWLARCGCRVTGLDGSPALLARARLRLEVETGGPRRASSPGQGVDFVEGEVGGLPFPDGCFDAVVSAFGAMHGGDGGALVAEMARVCRRGGTVAWTGWTPDGVFGCISRLLQDEGWLGAGEADRPFHWGREEWVRGWLVASALDAGIVQRRMVLRFPYPPGQVAEFLRQFFGPLAWVSGRLSPADRARLGVQVTGLLAHANTGSEGTTELGVDYLEVLGVRR